MAAIYMFAHKLGRYYDMSVLKRYKLRGHLEMTRQWTLPGRRKLKNVQKRSLFVWFAKGLAPDDLSRMILLTRPQKRILPLVGVRINSSSPGSFDESKVSRYLLNWHLDDAQAARCPRRMLLNPIAQPTNHPVF